MPEPTPEATTFVEGLNAKFGDMYTFTVSPGRTWDKIVASDTDGGLGGHVHAFVNRDTGFVHKSAGFNRAWPDPRYYDVTSALENADPYGSYLYANRAVTPAIG